MIELDVKTYDYDSYILILKALIDDKPVKLLGEEWRVLNCSMTPTYNVIASLISTNKELKFSD